MSKSQHSYKVNDDNTLTLPNGETMIIIDSSKRSSDWRLYYRMMPCSPFGETIKSLRFYKKTHYQDQGLFQEVITELIIPPKTQFYVENCNVNALCSKFRFERALVSNQTCIKTNKNILETYSMFDPTFRYLVGELVEPLGSFYNYDQWLDDGRSNATFQHGIHGFQSRDHARLFNL